MTKFLIFTNIYAIVVGILFLADNFRLEKKLIRLKEDHYYNSIKEKGISG